MDESWTNSDGVDGRDISDYGQLMKKFVDSLIGFNNDENNVCCDACVCVFVCGCCVLECLIKWMFVIYEYIIFIILFVMEAYFFRFNAFAASNAAYRCLYLREYV